MIILLSRKNNVTVSFDVIIKIQKSMLFCFNVKRSLVEISGSSVEISEDKAHKMLVNSGKEAELATGKELGHIMKGVMCQCASYQESKSKQKAVPKQSAHVPSTTVGQRFCFDSCKIMKPVDMKHMGK